MNFQNQKNKKIFSFKLKRNKISFIFPLLLSLLIIQHGQTVKGHHDTVDSTRLSNLEGMRENLERDQALASTTAEKDNINLQISNITKQIMLLGHIINLQHVSSTDTEGRRDRVVSASRKSIDKLEAERAQIQKRQMQIQMQQRQNELKIEIRNLNRALNTTPATNNLERTALEQKLTNAESQLTTVQNRLQSLNLPPITTLSNTSSSDSTPLLTSDNSTVQTANAEVGSRSVDDDPITAMSVISPILGGSSVTEDSSIETKPEADVTNKGNDEEITCPLEKNEFIIEKTEETEAKLLIQGKATCDPLMERVINECLSPDSLTENDEILSELKSTLSCPENDDGDKYSDNLKIKVNLALLGIKDKLSLCAKRIKETTDCCKEPIKCFGGNSGLSSTEISFLVALLSGTTSGVITAFTNGDNSNIKAICNGLSAAAAGAGISELVVGATCIIKADEICRGACNIKGEVPVRTQELQEHLNNKTTINIEDAFKDINSLQILLKDQCDRNATKGYQMVAESAALGTAAGLVAHHCEKIIGGEDGSGDNDTPENVFNRNKDHCAKPENANRDFCRICNPGSGTTATEYNTNTLMRYPSCRQLPVEGTVAETSLFSGGGGRSQIRTSNQGFRNSSQQQKSNLFSGYGRNNYSNLGQTSQISGAGGGGGNSSIGRSGGTTSGNLDSSSRAKAQNQAYNQTSDVGFSGAGGSGSSGSYYPSRKRSKSRWNLRDFLPGRKKDPKKKSSKISKSSRKKLLNVHSKQNNIFVTHSKIIHKFCSNKTLNQCQSSRSK